MHPPRRTKSVPLSLPRPCALRSIWGNAFSLFAPLRDNRAVRIGVCVPFAPLAPLALIGSEDSAAALLPCGLRGEKSGTSTLWKLPREIFHSMEKVIHAMETFFHTVEVPDFSSGLGGPDSPAPRGRGGLGRRAIRITIRIRIRITMGIGLPCERLGEGLRWGGGRGLMRG
jgi:hypothetical protein